MRREWTEGEAAAAPRTSAGWLPVGDTGTGTPCPGLGRVEEVLHWATTSHRREAVERGHVMELHI